MFKKILLSLTSIIISVLVSGTVIGASPTERATQYLHNNFSSQSPASRDWAALALGMNNQAVDPGQAPTDSILSLSRNSLARAAQGLDRTEAVNKIIASFGDNQFGDPALINDDIFATLAVRTTNSEFLLNHSGVFNTIVGSQRPDGSFGFSRNGDGDADMTAAAIWAIALAPDMPNTAISRAQQYLLACQNADGGFGFRPRTSSNIASSSWAMIAQATLGQDTSKERNYLLTNQQPDGSWLQGNNPSYLNTAYATMALSGQKLPYIWKVLPPTANQPAPSNQPNRSAPSNNSVYPASTSGAAPKTSATTPTAKPIAKKTVRRRVITTYTTETIIISCSASASASASASGSSSSATASASASCH